MIAGRARALIPAVLACGLSPQGLADLPRARTGTTLQFASTDPSGGNEDHSHCLRCEPDGTCVLAEAEGPGRVVRIWSANPGGALRIEIDDGKAFAAPFERLFAGDAPPFVTPLCVPYAGGFVCHVPLAFQRHLRITAAPVPGRYHQITVRQGEERESFAMPPGPTLAAELAALCAGADGRGEAQLVTGVPIAARTRLFARDGAGEIVELRAALRGARPRDVWLLVRYDGEPLPALAAPFDLLFPDLPATEVNGDAGGLCRFALPLPFRRRVEIEAVLRTDRPAAPPQLDLSVRTRPSIDDLPRRYLHARCHRDRTAYGRPFPVLHLQGHAGHLVGVVALLCGAPAQGLSFLEGDEAIAVDGRPALRGTGTEDFFGGGFYFRGAPAGSAFHAARVDAAQSRVLAARWLVADALPFTHDLQFDLEHGGNNDTPGADYTTLAFWYDELPDGEPPAPFDGTPEPPPWHGDPPLPALRQWRVAGPFACAPRRGLEQPFAPERDAAATAQYDVDPGFPRGWREASADAAGIVDLLPLFPRDHVVAYAFTWIDSPRDQHGVLWLGSDDGLQVFVDGKLVHTHQGLRGVGRDQDRVPLQLRRGRHALLLKIENYDGGFGYHARFEGSEGVTCSPRDDR
ncbi:MAG TPA: DUF2961 domain-containing protein [Planctomycetota bacterium]|nr:DUF2961 domain-containing protein [Planctomycetota bacterium]